jgi:hypothetical protein
VQKCKKVDESDRSRSGLHEPGAHHDRSILPNIKAAVLGVRAARVGPLGPFGPFGPPGPFGPLGPLGPLGRRAALSVRDGRADAARAEDAADAEDAEDAEGAEDVRFLRCESVGPSMCHAHSASPSPAPSPLRRACGGWRAARTRPVRFWRTRRRCPESGASGRRTRCRAATAAACCSRESRAGGYNSRTPRATRARSSTPRARRTLCPRRTQPFDPVGRVGRVGRVLVDLFASRRTRGGCAGASRTARSTPRAACTKCHKSDARVLGAKPGVRRLLRFCWRRPGAHSNSSST